MGDATTTELTEKMAGTTVAEATDSSISVVIEEVSPEREASLEEAAVSPTKEKEPALGTDEEVEKIVAATKAKIQDKYNRETLQADPSHPLYSQYENFESFGLNAALIKGVVALGFRKPSGIQARALPTLISTSEDVIVQSQSGTGKTATFSLTCLQKLDLSASSSSPQCMILSPSRELAIQTSEEVKKMGAFCQGLVVSTCIPMTEYPARVNYGHIAVGTVGRLFDITLKRKEIDLSKLKVVVIDEADEMLRAASGNSASGQQVAQIIKALNRKFTQVILVSATFPQNITRFVQTILPCCRNTFALQSGTACLSMDCIHHFYVYIPPNDETNFFNSKANWIKDACEFCDINQSIIFCNVAKEAERLNGFLTQQKHHVGLLTSRLEKEQRDAIMDAFRTSTTRILISTNVISRGVDVVQTSIVINFEVPQKVERGRSIVDAEAYLHRAGRTGRFGRPGVCITFVTTKQDIADLMEIGQQYKLNITGLSRDGSKVAKCMDDLGIT